VVPPFARSAGSLAPPGGYPRGEQTAQTWKDSLFFWPTPTAPLLRWRHIHQSVSKALVVDEP